MARDEIYDAMKLRSKEKFDSDRYKFLRNATLADDGLWEKHTDYHWSRVVDGIRVDYWPSRKKYMANGTVARGDVYKFIALLGGHQ